jgi:hypothetical protein
MSEILTPEERTAIYREWLNDKVNYDEDALIRLAEAAVLRKCAESLRDKFAMAALANQYTHDNSNPDSSAEWAYQLADAMLLARAAA